MRMRRGGSRADMRHKEKERGEGQAPFWVLRKKGAKKSETMFCRGGRLAKKSEKRLGMACSAGVQRGSWGTCSTSHGTLGRLGTQKFMAAKPTCKTK
jgi:hypothetical protein